MDDAREKLLLPPRGIIHAVIDTDTFNEVDDQFALAYLLLSPEAVQVEAVYAAPFLNDKVNSPEEGMLKSLEEIHRVLALMSPDISRPSVFPGARSFLPSEDRPVPSPAVEDLINRAKSHSPAEPLYVLGIAAATDLASALLLAPEVKDRVVFVWLGGSAFHRSGEAEFNLMEDCAAARVLFRSGVPLIHVPCWGVAEYFTVSRDELEQQLLNRNPLADFLARRVIAEADAYDSWPKTLWDVTAAAWLTDREGRFLQTELVPAPLPEPDYRYSFSENSHPMRYVRQVRREALLADMIKKLTNKGDILI